MNDAAMLPRMAQALGPQGLIVEAGDRAAYESSARHGAGLARAVLRPADVDQLSWTVRELASAGMHWVTQGAATGLVGGATPTADGTQWVLSTLRMKGKLEIDAINRSAVVSAGYRLSDLNRAAGEHGLCFPIDLGADPSIGGMVATNTGGARLLRYGGVRENLMAVEGVLAHPPGQRVGASRALHKNNTGLDWTQVLCGTFGAFGLVSQASLKLHALPQQRATALVALPSVDAALNLLCEFEAGLGEFVSAFEGVSGEALRAVAEHVPGLQPPFAVVPQYAALIEVATAIPRDAGLDLESLLVSWLEPRMESGAIVDAVIDKPEALWRIRHALSESVQALGRMVAFDLSVPRSRFADFRRRALEIVTAQVADARVCDFGHLGDGGVHLNMVVPQHTSAAAITGLRDALYDAVVAEFGGSYSAEHGVGPYNEHYYRRYADPALLTLAGELKRVLDPERLNGNVRLW